MRIRYSRQAAEVLYDLRNKQPLVDSLTETIIRENLTLDAALRRFGEELRRADY